VESDILDDGITYDELVDIDSVLLQGDLDNGEESKTEEIDNLRETSKGDLCGPANRFGGRPRE
jgi:hypothetical protein